MSILDTLVTNRTRKDFCDVEDLNRVAKAMDYVARRLQGCGCIVKISPKGDWTMTDMVFKHAGKHLLEDLNTIWNELALFHTTPIVPKGKKPFDAQEANDIEKILLDIERVIQKIEASWFYSAELYAGEV